MKKIWNITYSLEKKNTILVHFTNGKQNECFILDYYMFKIAVVGFVGSVHSISLHEKINVLF